MGNLKYLCKLQMKNEFTVQEMQSMVEAAKADLLIGLKKREALVYKHKFG